MAEIGEMIRSFGWAGAILIALGIVGWRGGINLAEFLKEKLFDDDLDPTGQPKGFVPRIVNAHLTMVSAVQKTAEDNSTILLRQDQTNKEILELVREGREDQRATKQMLIAMTKAPQRETTIVATPAITGVMVERALGDKS